MDASNERIYRDRSDAGRVLAEHLEHYGGRDDLLVLALPRGGVPVAWEVAVALDAPLDLMLVRKLGVPGHEELALGAIGSGGARVLNRGVVSGLAIAESTIELVAAREQAELRRREQAYRDDRPPVAVAGRCVVLIDDGLATGASMRAAVSALRQQSPGRIVVAVPVAPPETVSQLAGEVDEVICPAQPERFFGVGQWYDDFRQTTDDEVRDLLHRAWSRQR